MVLLSPSPSPPPLSLSLSLSLSLVFVLVFLLHFLAFDQLTRDQDDQTYETLLR